MIRLDSVSKQHGKQILFLEASAAINRGEKVGLVGPNGAGKSTIFRLVTKEEEPDGGQVAVDRGTTIGHFRQDVGEMKGQSVVSASMDGAGPLSVVAARLRELEAALADPDRMDEMDQLVEEFGQVQGRFEELGGYALEAKAREILAGLGFPQEVMDRDVGTLSGGWKVRVALARILLMRPDVLLLDEPTNHLDLESIIWLEGFLQTYEGAVVMTCHDREFMNRIVTKIIDIDGGDLISYTGNYDFYEKQRAQREAQAEAQFERQQAMLAKEQAFIDRFKARASHAAQVQSRVKKLEKIEKVEPPRKRKAVRFDFPEAPRSGDDVAKVEGVHKAYGSKVVLGGLDLLIRRRERWCIMGVNGAGKSTLLKLIASHAEPDRGRVSLGASVKMGYFAQHAMDVLDPEGSVWSTLVGAFPKASIGSLRTLAGVFGFSGDDVEKPCRILSGGEKARLVLAKMLYDPPNFLVLDEPTNHLDVDTKAMLIDALKGYEGTMIFVSHDRHFLRELSNRVLELLPDGPHAYGGGYTEYVAQVGYEAPGLTHLGAIIGVMNPTLSRRLLLQSLLAIAACGDDGDTQAQTGAPGGAGGTGGTGGAGGKAGTGGAGAGGGQAGGGQAGGGQAGESGASGQGGAGPTGAFPFDVWGELRDALRLSPDHLAFEAQRQVASKDAAAIFLFVQRSFGARPVLGGSFSSNPTQLQGWGRRGLLRSGSGTPRDKADLLRDLLEQAGFEASVVAGPVDAKSYWPRVFGATPSREFKPAITDERLGQLRGKLSLGAPAPVEVIDAKGEAASALADSLLGLLPGERKADELPALDATSAPLVRVKVGGKTLVCDPNDPEATFEGGPADQGLSDPGPATEPPVKLELTFSVLMTTSKAPIDLVSAQYRVADVVGRTVSVALAPPGGLDAVLLSSLRDVRTFRPHIAVSGPDLAGEEREKLLFAGDGFTVGGDIIKATEGSIEVNGIALDPSTGPADPAQVAKVASLSLSLSSSSFPQIRLRATALDKDGAAVSGLGASAFALSEDGKRAGATLTENRPRPPRVFFVLDKSDSIPADFKGEPAAAALREVAQAIKAQIAGAQFNVFAVSGVPDAQKWTDDPEQLYADALAAKPIFGSDLWDAMARASDESPSFVVLVTDGDSTDEPSLKTSVRVTRIPGSLVLKVGSVDGARAAALAAASNGELLPIAALEQAKQAMIDALKKAEKSAYALQYRADEAGPTTRKVSLSLGAATAEITYEVPAPEQRVTPPRLAGLLLKIKQGGEEVTRLLAGVRQIDDDLDPAALEQAALACFGAIDLRVEGEPPTASAAVDELLSARLSAEPFVTATRAGDVAAALDALEAGWERPGAVALGLCAISASAASGPITGSGLRGVLTTLQPTPGKQLIHRTDLLPIGPLRSLNADRKAAFDEALRGSMRLALAEQAIHLDSTLARLEGESLVYLAPYQGVDGLFPALDPAEKKAWNTLLNGYNPYHRVLPASGKRSGFLAIHEKTGSTLAVLPDGTGGSATKAQIEADMQWMISVLNWASAVGGYFGVIGLVGGVWISFEKAKLKKIIQATIAIATLDAPPGSDGFTDSLKDVVCDLLKGLAGEAFDRLIKQGYSVIQALGILGKSTLLSDSFIEAALNKAPIECF